MHSEKYSLKWQAYSDHLKSMMQELMMNEDFSDVTLVTEDKKQIKANINILSACSPFFKDVLKKDKNSSPIMYLRGIQYSELESIVQFIYLGEATYYEERIDEFLAVAKSLEIKELCNAETETNDESDDIPSINYQDTSTDLVEEQTIMPDQIKNQVPQERQESASRDIKKYNCEQCPNTYYSNSALWNHRQSSHEIRKYDCEQCTKTYSSHGSLWKHKQLSHQGIKYVCDQCDLQFTSQGSLNRHIQSKHEGVMYSCNQCDHQYEDQAFLRKHILSKHEGVRYDCDQCQQQFTLRKSLTIHIQ